MQELEQTPCKGCIVYVIVLGGAISCQIDTAQQIREGHWKKDCFHQCQQQWNRVRGRTFSFVNMDLFYNYLFGPLTFLSTIKDAGLGRNRLHVTRLHN